MSKSKSILSAIAILLMAVQLSAQDCLPGWTTFSTQEEIDNFLLNNPSCTNILGDLTISNANSDINNLDGLSNIISISGNLGINVGSEYWDNSGLSSLTTVGGGLTIYGTEAWGVPIDGFTLQGLQNLSVIGDDLRFSSIYLENLSGLEKITSIPGELFILESNIKSFVGLDNLVSVEGLNAYNNLIENFEGLNKLTTISGPSGLIVRDNYFLKNLSGLNSLTNITSMEIVGNDDLLSLIGLQNLKSIIPTASQSILIQSNASLESISALNGLTDFGNLTLEVSLNISLNFCAEVFICNFLNNGGQFIVEFNGTECSFLGDVQLGCQSQSKIVHNAFLDKNVNGVLDIGESTFPFGNIRISPNGILSYSNAGTNGTVFIGLGQYMIDYEYANFPYFDLTTDNASQLVELDAANPIATLSYGLTPNQDISFLNIHLVPSSSRCLEWSTLQLILENPGTTTCSGILWFQNDLNTLDIAFNDPPDYNPSDGLYGWDFSDLEPGQHFIQSIEVQLPGPPDFPVGDFLNFAFEAEFNDVNGAHTTNESFYRMLIECSYDPNDKLVSPTYPDGYALIGEELVYTVRFQNTGNAVAYDVVIRDTLDAYLDPSTFRVISTSHPDQLQTTMTDDQFLSFDFPNIFLPDSTADFDGSQGYVLYAIRAEGEIPEAQVVENTAGIYFDMNQPVITNTTSNIMVTTFDADADGFEIWLDCDEDDPNINPGAEEIANNDIDEDCDGMDLITGINELAEIPFDIFPNPTSDAIQITADNLGEFDLRLMDCFGKWILDTTFSGNKNIQLAELPAGVYFLTIGDGESEWSERVVKL